MRFGAHCTVSIARLSYANDVALAATLKGSPRGSIVIADVLFAIVF
jgi:hypothetical protein